MANWRDDLGNIIKKRENKKTTTTPTTKGTSPTTTKTEKDKTPTTGKTTSGSWKDELGDILETQKPKNKDELYELKTADGKSLGTVSYDAAKAIENDKLDNYLPKTREEKKILDEYKNNVTYELKLNDGKSFGFVSYDAYKAIKNDKLDSYKPKNTNEKKIIDDFKSYVKNIENDATSNLTKEQKAYIKYAVNKESDIKGINNEQKLLGGNTAQWVAAPKKSGWDKFVEGAKEFFLPDGSNAKKIYDEATDFKDDDTGWTDDQLAKLAINALHKADSGDTSDFAIVDRAYARLSHSTKYKDSDLVLALKEAKKSWGASPWTAAGVNIKAAVAGVSGDISSFANSLGADNVPVLKDITNSSVEYAEKARQDAAEYNKGTYGEYLGAITQGAVNLVPYYFLGSGKAAQTALTKGPKYVSYIKAVANNPSFWYSLTTMWGNKYQEALNGGATEADALKNAALYAIPAALVEIAGGIGSEKMAGQKLSETIIEEIGEEIAQDLISGASDKLTTKPDLPIFSTKEDAIINPVNLLKTAVTTAPIVAIGGAANQAINSVVNQYNKKKELSKLTNNPEVLDAITNFVTTVEPTVTEESSTVETPIVAENTTVEQTTPVATEQANIVTEEVGDTVSAEIPTASVGETFVDSSSNKLIKVVGRNDTAPTVEITTADGKTETKQVPNKTADRLAIEDRYNKVETPAETVTASDEEVVEPQAETQSVNVGDVYVNKNTGDMYTIVDRDAETTTIYIKNKNGISTQKIANILADDSFADGDTFTKATSVNDTVNTEAEISPVANENIPTNETVPSDNITATDDEISAIVSAVNDALIPEAKAGILKGMDNKGVDGGLVEFADKLTQMYKKSGSLNGLEKYFTDKGESFIAAVEGRTETPTVAENTVTEPAVETENVPNRKAINLKRVGNYYEVYGDEAVALASEIGDKTQRAVVNGAETDVLRVPADLMVKASETMSEDFDFTFSDKPNAETKAVAKSATTNEVLKNQSESDIIKEKSKPSAEQSSVVEGKEDGNEQGRKDLLHEDGKRGNNESTREYAGGILSDRRQDKGRNATERKDFARELIERGQTEQVTIEGNTMELVKPEAYNDEMLAMVEDAKSKGKELGFFVGEGTLTVVREDGTVQQKPIDGVRIDKGKLYVQYDANRSPQILYKHEYCHDEWDTPEMQSAANKILGSLTEVEKKALLTTARYKTALDGYTEYYKGNVDKAKAVVWEEFVCDVMSGMNDYASKYSDVVADYWNGNESADNYKVAEYSESTDAGGEARYSMYSYPRLNNSEWALLNRRLEIEIGNEDNFIDEHTKWLYASKNGTRVFAIYGIGWGDDATPLYAVGGKKAEKKYNEMLFFMEEENEEHTGNKEDFESWLSNYVAIQGTTGDNISDDGNRKTSTKNGSVHSKQQASNGKGIDGRGTENSNEVNNSPKDSTGRKLSKGQQEYFKDSKVRDDNGTLKVMYRGDKDNFTVFDKKKTKHSNLYGRGFYFTDSKSHAEQYGDAREYYLDIKNPLSPKQNAITKKQMLNFLKAIENNGEDYDLYNYGEGATAESVLNSVWGKGDFEMLQDVSAGAIGDLVAAVELFNEVNGTNYDGIVLPTETVTFESEQAKFTSNLNPTTDKDVRFSFSEEQNADYMKAVESGDMETAQKMVDEAAEKSFPNSKVRGTDGKLRAVYHGTVSDFTVFKREFANIEGDFGKGYYFTSNEYDVGENYANEEGPDLKNKIALYAERLEWDDEYSDLSYEEREEIARQKFITSEPNTITAYLNMENPVYITPDENGTFLDFNEAYDEEYDEYGEPEGLFVDFIEALKDNASDYAYNDVNFDFLWEHVYDEGGMYASDAVKIIKNNIIDELSDENGNLAISEVIRLAFEQIGFDGIIDTSVYYKFRNMSGMDSGTTHYIVFDSEQIKSAEPVTYDDDGNIISLDDRFNKDNVDFRYSFAEKNNLETQKKIEGIAEEIGSHDEFISLAKQNTREFVEKIKANESLQKRLQNAKRQMLVSPTPTVNVTKAGNITKEILGEMESTLKANDLKNEVMSIYNEYFAEVKKAKGIQSKVQEANDNMMDRFAKLAVDIVESSVAYAESEEHELLKSYVKNTRINIPEDAKSEVHYAEFRKAHMGTFNLTNDGLPIDRAYQELCGMFPGLFSEEVTSPADQLNAIAEALETTKPYAYNPHESYMLDAIDHVVFRFASEVDGLAVVPKTKAQKMADKSAYEKEMALEKERTSFEQKLGKHKEQSENTIRKLQKKIDDAKYVSYWEKRLSKEEKAKALKDQRDRRDVAILKSKIRNIVSDMKSKLDKTEKAGGYPKELVKAAAEICSVLDFHTDRTNKDGTPTKASLKLDALKMQYDALKNNPNYDLASEYSEELSDRIAKLHQTVSGKRVVDLNKVELTNLKDILREISTRLSEASKQIGQANARANVEIATDIINSLKLDNKAISEVRNQLLKEMKLAKESGKAFVINPHRIFEMIANYDRDSAWWQLYDQILRGSRNAAKFTMDANMPFDELTDGGGNEIAFYDFRTKMRRTGIKYTDGTDVELPKSIICELVMLWDRKQGRSHLESGGVKIPDLKLFNKGKTADALASGKITNAITQQDIDRLKGMLDSYDKAWIEKSHHLFNTVAKNAINEISMQLVGREIAKADNYIRIYVDSDFVKKDIGKNESDITIEGHGSLKETTPDAKNPVILRGLHENVYEHIDFTSKYYGLAIPIRNFNKVYNISVNEDGKPNSVKNILGSVYGSKVRDGVVVQVIKDLQSPRHRELSMFNKVKGGWLNATFWANIRSTLKQTTSYWTSSSILGEDSLVKGLANYNAHRKQTKAEISKYSGTLYKRAQGLSTTELGDRANRKRLAGLSSKTTKFINEHLPVLRNIPEWIRPGNWLQSMDCAVSSALWEACKAEVSKTMKVSDDGYMQAVTDLYERVIEETQSNYDVLHRPEILKTTNSIWQTVGMFQNDNLQQTGIMYTALGDLKAKKKAYEADKSSANEQKLADAKKRMSKAVRSRIYSSMWLAAVSMLGDILLRKFKPYIDEEEKEITSRSVLEQMKLKMSEDMIGVFAPVVGQLVTKAMDTFGEGYDFLNDPAFDVLEDFIKATSKIYKAYDTDGDVLKAWTDAIPAISNMTGVPAKNISDLYNGIKGYISDIKAGEFSHDLEDYTSGNKSFYNHSDLASYIVNGDKEKETKLLEYYSENGKEVSKASLTTEIKPAYVQAYIDSPQEAYNIKRKLILEYGYSEDTIKKWTVNEYFKHIIPDKKFDDGTVSNPEYAVEIATAVRKESNWFDSLYSTIRSNYKSVYKEGNKDEIETLKKALIKDFRISSSDIREWEDKAETEIKKKTDKQAAEKAKYK